MNTIERSTSKKTQSNPPMRLVRQCRTCSSPHRTRVEQAVLEDLRPSQVIEILPQGHGLTQRHIEEHVRRGHLPVDQAEVERYLGQRRQEIEQMICDLGTQKAKAEIDRALLVMGAGFIRLRDGSLNIRGADLVRAMKMFFDRDALELQAAKVRLLADQRDYERSHELARVFEIVEAEVGPDAAGRIITRAVNDRSSLGWTMVSDPVLRPLLDHPTRQ